MNFIKAQIESSGAKTKLKTTSGKSTMLPILTPKEIAGQTVSIGISPEDLTLVSASDAIVRGKVEALENLGE